VTAPFLTSELEARWHTDGWCVVEDLFPPAAVAAACDAVPTVYPTADEFADDADPDRIAPYRSSWEAVRLRFPFESPALNDIVVHPSMMELARRLLGTDSVLLYQGLLSAKYSGGPADAEQLMHVDYGNHTLVVPRDDAGYRQLETFVYLSDITAETGATRVVSRHLTAHIPVERTTLAFDKYADLYDAEVPAVGRAGSVLAYRPDVFHRGVAVRAPRAARYLLHVAYKSPDTDWLGFQSLPFHGNDRAWYRFVARATVEQLTAVGFPAPGHAYWTDSTLAGVAARYPTLDLEPWRREMHVV
jgi:hypothetical protein